MRNSASSTLLANYAIRRVPNSSFMSFMCSRAHQAVKRSSFLKLFPATVSLQHIAFDILGPLVKSNSSCKCLLVITDRYSKLTRAVLMGKTSAYTVAKAFCDDWIFVYGTPRTVISDNGKQFNSKFSSEPVRY